jgi:catechol 2,3-dioxygenase-like lactoylglutathione lyase family enzyme
MEIVLEVRDLEKAASFYRDTLGMPEITRWTGERPAVWVKAATGTYLGLWTAKAGGPGVGVHGSRGGAHVHLAFLVPAGALAALEERLQEAGAGQVERVEFASDQTSLFVEDLDGNVLEFADWSRSWEDRPVER